MRAAVFGDSGNIAVTDRAVPEPRPGWARVAVQSVGICGSDLNLLYAHGDRSIGVQPGHEVAGVIDLAGDGTTLAAGTPVAVEPVIGCGDCPQCRIGAYNLCASVKLCGFSRPGGMAEFFTVPARCLYPLPEGLAPHTAALAEPMAVCVRGIRLAGVGLGERVAVLGSGTIGLMSVLAARAAGAGEVVATARYPHQREQALALGADQVFGDTESLLAALGDEHVDVVVETVGGHADTLQGSVQVARSGGRIVMLGVFDHAPPMPAFEFFRKEQTLRGSNCYGHDHAEPDFATAVTLVAAHAGRLEPLVTHRFKLDQVAEAFAAAADKTSRSIKVQVEP